MSALCQNPRGKAAWCSTLEFFRTPRRSSLAALLLGACLSTQLAACIAAPRDVETTLTFGDDKIDIDVKVKDIRAAADDDLGQLRTFFDYAQWKPSWIEDLPWAPSPDVYEFSLENNKLNLTMHGSMTRSEFDRCVRIAQDGKPRACPKFPFDRLSAGYALSDEVKQNRSIVLDRDTPAAWPFDAQKISVHFRPNKEEVSFIAEGPSLSHGYTLVQAMPLKAAETLNQISAGEALFMDSTGEQVRAQVAELESCSEPRWCAFRLEAARREAAHLVYAYLRGSPQAGTGVRAPPALGNDLAGRAFASRLPKDKLALLDELKLRIAYDVMLDGYREQGSMPATTWDAVCRPDTMKKPTLKDFCLRIGWHVPKK